MPIGTATTDGAKPEDLARPGHVFPLQAKGGGVLVRTGQTEGSVDLARLAGLKPYAVICEIMNENGVMARRGDLEIFAKKHSLKIVTIADLIRYRLQNEYLVRREAITTLPTIYGGDFRAIAYENEVVELIPIEIKVSRRNAAYLKTRKKKMGHLLTID